MKTRLIIFCLFIQIFPSWVAWADCIDLSQQVSLTNILNNYQTYSYKPNPESPNFYKLCFINKKENVAVSYSVTALENDKLEIEGLNLKTDSQKWTGSSPLLTLTGSNITIIGSTFQGPGNGTMLQINGSNITLQDSVLTSSGTVLGIADGLSNILLKNVKLTGKDTLIDLAKISKLEGTNSFTTTGTGPVIKIPVNYGEFAIKDAAIAGANLGAALEIPAGVKATIGPNVSFTDFASGVYIAKEATALVTQDKFTNVTTPIAYEIPAFAGMTINADWFGKHISDADTNKVDRIAGKLDLTACSGSVEMYVRTDNNPATPLQYNTTCPVGELKEKPLKLTLADKSEKEIAIGSCYFDCDKLDVLKDNYVSFLYSSATNQTAEFMPLPAVKVSELGDVITIGMGSTFLPTSPQGADETTIVVTSDQPDTVTVTQDQKDLLVDGADDAKGSQIPPDDNDGGGQVGQGVSGGCSLIRAR